MASRRVFEYLCNGFFNDVVYIRMEVVRKAELPRVYRVSL